MALFFKKPENNFFWQIVAKLCILSTVLVPLAIIIVPFFTQRIRYTVHLVRSIVQDQAVYDYFNEGVQMSFVVTLLSYTNRIFLYTLHSSYGLGLGIIGYTIFLCNSTRMNHKVGQFNLLRTCVILISFLQPIASIVPVVIIFQQMGVLVSWLNIWIFMWVCMAVISIYFGIVLYATPRYIRVHLIVTLVLYLATFVIGTSISLSREQAFLQGFVHLDSLFPAFQCFGLFCAWALLGIVVGMWITTNIPEGIFFSIL